MTLMEIIVFEEVVMLWEEEVDEIMVVFEEVLDSFELIVVMAGSEDSFEFLGLL